jgi:alpha-L-fucosidase
MNGTWGFKTSDTHWKSSQDLIRKLCDIASKGGNFLLNVGPRGDGTIPPESVERLHRMGAWMKVNGDAIHGTDASPFPRKVDWGRVTRKAGTGAGGTPTTTLNLIVFEWPKDGTLHLDGLRNEPLGVKVLGGADRTAKAARDERGVTVTGLGAAPVDADATVVQLTVAGAAQVDPAYITPGADGTVACKAADAVPTGSIQYEGQRDNLGWWKDTASTASWTIKLPAAGTYAVALDYACNASCGGDIEVDVGGAKLKATLPPRTDWGDFATVPVGKVPVPGGKPVTVTVRALTKPGEAFINLRSVTLTPVK